MRSPLKTLARDDSGSAIIELGLVALLLLACVMNVGETAHYAYQASQVAAAAQAGAQAALNACDEAHTPATLNCPGLKAAATTAIQASSLGDQVSLSGPITEAYYCLTLDNQLQQVGAANAKPADCSAAHNLDATPTLYLQMPVSYTYQAIFPGLTVVQSFATPIQRTAWMRMS